jgi:hypothetical protein
MLFFLSGFFRACSDADAAFAPVSMYHTNLTPHTTYSTPRTPTPHTIRHSPHTAHRPPYTTHIPHRIKSNQPHDQLFSHCQRQPLAILSHLISSHLFTSHPIPFRPLVSSHLTHRIPFPLVTSRIDSSRPATFHHRHFPRGSTTHPHISLRERIRPRVPTFQVHRVICDVRRWMLIQIEMTGNGGQSRCAVRSRADMEGGNLCVLFCTTVVVC